MTERPAPTTTEPDNEAPYADQSHGGELPQVHEIRLEDPGQSTGIDFATYAGDRLPMGDYLRVIVPWELIIDAHRRGTAAVTVSTTDVSERDRRIYARRAERQERERDARILAEAKARIAASAQDRSESGKTGGVDACPGATLPTTGGGNTLTTFPTVE